MNSCPRCPPGTSKHNIQGGRWSGKIVCDGCDTVIFHYNGTGPSDRKSDLVIKFRTDEEIMLNDADHRWMTESASILAMNVTSNTISHSKATAWFEEAIMLGMKRVENRKMPPPQMVSYADMLKKDATATSMLSPNTPYVTRTPHRRSSDGMIVAYFVESVDEIGIKKRAVECAGCGTRRPEGSIRECNCFGNDSMGMEWSNVKKTSISTIEFPSAISDSYVCGDCKVLLNSHAELIGHKCADADEPTIKDERPLQLVCANGHKLEVGDPVSYSVACGMSMFEPAFHGIGHIIEIDHPNRRCVVVEKGGGKKYVPFGYLWKIVEKDASADGQEASRSTSISATFVRDQIRKIRQQEPGIADSCVLTEDEAKAINYQPPAKTYGFETHVVRDRDAVNYKCMELTLSGHSVATTHGVERKVENSDRKDMLRIVYGMPVDVRAPILRAASEYAIKNKIDYEGEAVAAPTKLEYLGQMEADFSSMGPVVKYSYPSTGTVATWVPNPIPPADIEKYGIFATIPGAKVNSYVTVPNAEAIRKSIENARRELAVITNNGCKVDCVVFTRAEADKIEQYNLDLYRKMGNAPTVGPWTYMGFPMHVAADRQAVRIMAAELASSGKNAVTTEGTVRSQPGYPPVPGNWVRKDFVSNPLYKSVSADAKIVDVDEPAIVEPECDTPVTIESDNGQRPDRYL